MGRYRSLALVALVVLSTASPIWSFVPRQNGAFHNRRSAPFSTSSSELSEQKFAVTEVADPNYNAVPVAKTGGAGSRTASEDAVEKNLSLGAPGKRPVGGHFLTKGGVQVTAQVDRLIFDNTGMAEGTSNRAVEDLVDKLDGNKGVLLTSSYEFPGRYARWSLGFVDPPLEVSGRENRCTIKALNERGTVILPAVIKAMESLKDSGALESIDVVTCSGDDPEEECGVDGTPIRVNVVVVPPAEVGSFSEEDRSRQPTLFSVVRSLIDLFGYEGGDGQLGLYGAFGYDLTFQFEPIKESQIRDDSQRDILLYLPDEILVVDQDKRDAWKIMYDFNVDKKSTQGMPRVGDVEPFEPFDEEDAEAVAAYSDRDTPKGDFTESVERAKGEFAVGNLFEAVLSQTFRNKLTAESPPSAIFRRLRGRNPAPYGFLINLGEEEYLIGASPEMFVRCERIEDNDYRPGAFRVETCPISGTVSRGADALEDAQRVKSLMMNQKEESELTMCTDVDRNDKSRICEPGSVKVIGRRQIEMYSRLIHTVDHVEGYLRPEFDALDAFLCHTWAVTVTGAPKTWAIQFVEDNERSPRHWYGAAVGMVGFDGSMNTGLTLRTVRVKSGVAEVRAGATLLYDSNPAAEEQETELKASAMIDAVVSTEPVGPEKGAVPSAKNEESVGAGKQIILIDHEDSFVHTLGNYLRQTGADVKTLRSGPSALAQIDALIRAGNKPDMVVLSPGPGTPSDFKLSTTIAFLEKNHIPGFGVCLGLQGMVEHFGGVLGVLSYPMHGKPSPVTLTMRGKDEKSIFTGIPDTFEVARYHSLHGIKDSLPDCLDVTAMTEDGIVMGIQHKSLPYAAVQFHPESILTDPRTGMSILKNALTFLRYEDDEKDSTVANGDIATTGAQIVAELEEKGVSELKDQLKSAGLSTSGSKSQLIVRLALWIHKSNEAKAGRLSFDGMTVPDLRELKQGLGLKGTAPTRGELIEVLNQSLLG
mmetsp:Transcript_10414/g.22068  ORF Transcript_10414/g.22068 Transcript_10414/m.22068 type:complete len:984 (+) Transcript_10414:256-3207(+)|eukprot:CAMPEP_0178483004 /NCGR_PEP_ID=MMETSP0696-20121128/7012_1 /TAXON_ID=265572 /ORGANISM="Extubocellulus spinifer, Strain CCMP396" /LENGTH=983 /DNA_ID=CAMNT_0020110511 /DNA_START=255 /DNA_END=3206 /DNA_ORIENTATION=+